MYWYFVIRWYPEKAAKIMVSALEKGDMTKLASVLDEDWQGITKEGADKWMAILRVYYLGYDRDARPYGRKVEVEGAQLTAQDQGSCIITGRFTPVHQWTEEHMVYRSVHKVNVRRVRQDDKYVWKVVLAPAQADLTAAWGSFIPTDPDNRSEVMVRDSFKIRSEEEEK